MEQKHKYKTWCTVNTDNLVHNYLYTKEKANNRVICVVKADGYGHGAAEIAKKLMEAGCDFFAVSSFHEAKELRDAGIDCGILVLGRILPCEIEQAVSLDISLAAGTVDFITDIIRNNTSDKKARIHIKLNTGMNRTGFDAIHYNKTSELEKALALINENEEIFDVEGVFSHFAKAEDDEDFSLIQFERFMNAVAFIENHGIIPKIRHISNSAGSLNYPDFRLDAVRLGIYLYGCETDDENYLPVMSFHSRILEIKELEKGDGVGYGLDFTADKNMRIAIVGAGYADGVFRSLSNGKGYVTCAGTKCPIVGRVCMDMLMIDTSHIDSIKPFDTVTIFGYGSGGFIPCSVQAKNAGTISYELLCAVSKRVPRLYI